MNVLLWSVKIQYLLNLNSVWHDQYSIESINSSWLLWNYVLESHTIKQVNGLQAELEYVNVHSLSRRFYSEELQVFMLLFRRSMKWAPVSLWCSSSPEGILFSLSWHSAMVWLYISLFIMFERTNKNNKPGDCSTESIPVGLGFTKPWWVVFRVQP